MSSLSTHENCVCVCVCLHVFVCIHPTSAIVGKGGVSFLLLCLELSQERLGRPKRDPSIDRVVDSPSLSYCMAVLAHTDLQWCLLTWQHIHQIAIHLPPPPTSLLDIHSEATHSFLWDHREMHGCLQEGTWLLSGSGQAVCILTVPALLRDAEVPSEPLLHC